jgi:hypothetical protein
MAASERPPAAELLPALFDDQGRLRKDQRRHVIAELRCPRKRHLLAVVARTPLGPWAAWRIPGHGWLCGWMHTPADPNVGIGAFAGCHCARQGGPKSWMVPLAWLATQHGTVLPPRLPFAIASDASAAPADALG